MLNIYKYYLFTDLSIQLNTASKSASTADGDRGSEEDYNVAEVIQHPNYQRWIMIMILPC